MADRKVRPTDRQVKFGCWLLCMSGIAETGEGTCALICLDQIGDARKRPCPHQVEVFGKRVIKILTEERDVNGKIRW